MIINHNMNAMNAHRQMGTNLVNNGKSIEKLSSGLRINRAGDDAAGLAISEKMRGQIRGLDMASKNAQDGISLIQTAEGALNETHSILQRMRELSVQASNDTNTSDDRAEMQKELDQLTSEIDRIGNTTEFNTKKLLNGGAGIQATQTTGTGLEVVSGNAGVKAGGDLVLTGVAAADSAKVVFTGGAAALTIGSAGANIKVNGVTVSMAAGTTAANMVTAFNNVSGQTGVTAAYDTSTNKLTLSTDGVGSAQKIDISGVALTALGNAADTFVSTAQVTMGDNDAVSFLTANAIAGTTVSNSIGDDAAVTVDNTTTGVDPTASSRGNEVTLHGGDFDGLVINVENASAASTLHIDANNSLTLQIGANENQEMNVSIQDMRAAALGVDNIDVSSQSNAKSAITTIDDAIKSVSGSRSKLGAYQNRLEHTINNLGTSSENLTAAESRIRDVDMAKEMMTFSKTNILSQAAQAMLAQANQQPQGVLQLLR